MSFKAKNLTVNSEEPDFLKRLRGEVGDSVERQNHPITRPRQRRPVNDDDDDAPTYVADEATNETLSKAEVERLKGASAREDDPKVEKALEPRAPTNDQSKTDELELKKEKVGQIGAASKRRIAKIVGEGNAEEDRHASDESSKKRKKTERKKTKVKLSFEDNQ